MKQIWKPNEDVCELEFVIAVVGVDGDWPAWGKLMGVRLWNHALYPCTCCTVPQVDILSMSNYTAVDGPWSNYTQMQYWIDVGNSKLETPFAIELLLL